MLKSYGVGGGGGPCDYSVSPWSKSFFFSFFGELLFNFGVCWDRGLDLDLDQGLTIILLPDSRMDGWMDSSRVASIKVVLIKT